MAIFKIEDLPGAEAVVEDEKPRGCQNPEHKPPRRGSAYRPREPAVYENHCPSCKLVTRFVVDRSWSSRVKRVTLEVLWYLAQLARVVGGR